MDVIAGSIIMSSLLIPSAHLINQSRASAHRLDVRQALLSDAEEVIETAKISLSEPAAFSAAHASGIDTVNKHETTFGSFSVVRTQITADRSVLPARLVTIMVEAWYDDDRDGRLDATETSAALRTQFAAP
jgi:hypothetical protein